MGNTNCCSTEVAARPEPPDSLHSLRTAIHTNFSIEAGAYELRGQHIPKIQTDADYITEVSQKTSSEFHIDVISQQQILSATQQCRISERQPEQVGTTLRATDMITFDAGLGLAYRIDIQSHQKDHFQVHGEAVLSSDAAWIIFSAQFVLFTGGGLKEKTYDLQKVFILMINNQSNAFNVSHKTPMFHDHAQHGIVKHKGDIYVLGGLDKYAVSTSCMEKYSIADNSWTQLQDMPKPTNFWTAAECQDVIYFSDFNARTIFTYHINSKVFGRLNVQIPQGQGKLLTVLQDELVFLSTYMLLKIDLQSKRICKERVINLDTDFQPSTT